MCSNGQFKLCNEQGQSMKCIRSHPYSGWDNHKLIFENSENVMLSSTEAEYCALSLGVQELQFTQQLLEEIVGIEYPGVIFEDNTGAIYLVKNSQVGQWTKHIDICHHYIRELYGEGKLQVRFVNTEFNEANVCTKNVTEAIQQHHRDSICQGKLNVWQLYKSKVLQATREDQRQSKEEVFAASITFKTSMKITTTVPAIIQTTQNGMNQPDYTTFMNKMTLHSTKSVN